jgi:hypothetical protein
LDELEHIPVPTLLLHHELLKWTIEDGLFLSLGLAESRYFISIGGVVIKLF